MDVRISDGLVGSSLLRGFRLNEFARHVESGGMCGSDGIEAVVDRWRDGDEEAVEELYVRYADRLWKVARTQISQRLGRRFDADDVVQSVFRTFFRRARNGEFAIDQSVSLWQLLVKITINKVRRKAKFHKAAKRNVGLEVHASDGEILPDILAELPDTESADVLLGELDDLLARLDERESEIVRLCLDGYSTSEIGERVGRSRSTVRRLLNRAGGLLQKRFQQDSCD